MIKCYSFYGCADWSRESVNRYMECAGEIFRLCERSATHYGYCSEPFVRNGHGIGSVHNLCKKLDRIYNDGNKLRSLEFFDLPKQYVCQYSEYSVYLGRGKDYILFAVDASCINDIPFEEINLLLIKNISAVWGEHFKADNDAPIIAYCMNQYSGNTTGSNLVSNSSLSLYGEEIYVIEQYKV